MDGRLRKTIPIAVTAVLAVAVAVAIYLLTEQPPDATSSESDFINRFLIGLFGGIPGLYDPDTGLWLGVNIRHWAHTAEFFLLGIFVALLAYFVFKPRLLRAGVVSFATCLACSLFDQCHKLFVPGRHFDGFDLVMDALGYVVAILVVLLIAKLRGVHQAACD